nr:protein phosphatase 2C domain-containing protein [Streptomyces sp. TP-A0875]
MSQQGGRPTGPADDWWTRLYDDSTGDTGPTPAPDTLDDRFTSASRTVRPAGASSGTGAAARGAGPADADPSTPPAPSPRGTPGARPPVPPGGDGPAGPPGDAHPDAAAPAAHPGPVAPPVDRLGGDAAVERAGEVAPSGDGAGPVAPGERPGGAPAADRPGAAGPSAERQDARPPRVNGTAGPHSPGDGGAAGPRPGGDPDDPAPPRPAGRAAAPYPTDRHGAAPLPTDQRAAAPAPDGRSDDAPCPPDPRGPVPSPGGSRTGPVPPAPAGGNPAGRGEPPHAPGAPDSAPPWWATPEPPAFTDPRLPDDGTRPPARPTPKPADAPPADARPADAPRSPGPPPETPPADAPPADAPPPPADAPAPRGAGPTPPRAFGVWGGPPVPPPEAGPPLPPPPPPFVPAQAPAPPAAGGPASVRGRDHVGSGPPTYDPEPTALPPAHPDHLDTLVPDTVLDGARYGPCTLRAVSVRGDSARYRGVRRRDALLVARFGAGEQGLLLVAMASGTRACGVAHLAAAEACRWIGRAVGHSQARLAEDLRAARRGDLKSGLHRLTDRSLGRLRAGAAEQGLDPEEYTASLRCLLLSADPVCRTRVFFGVGDGGLFRLRDGAWRDLEPSPATPAGTPGDGRPRSDPRLAPPPPPPPPPGGPAVPPPRVPFRFRASVARPGDVLLMCGAGLAEPLRDEPELRELLARRWSAPTPPGLAGFLADTGVRVKGHADDRTAAALWEA